MQNYRASSKTTTHNKNDTTKYLIGTVEIIGVSYDNPIVFIEDYSFGSKRRVFNLAENMKVC